MAKQKPTQAAGYAASFAPQAQGISLDRWTQGVENLFARSHGANFVWQDTTSNATYCNASVALSSSKGVS